MRNEQNGKTKSKPSAIFKDLITVYRLNILVLPKWLGSFNKFTNLATKIPPTTAAYTGT